MKILKCVAKSLATFLLFVVAVFTVFSVSPVYDFAPAKPFEGPDIFNPYARLDTAAGWKRANFHTHTRVSGLLNECEYWPDEVLRRLRDFGYGIVTFSNHNELTQHPTDPALQVNVYEHGYNLFKYHKLVFGCRKVMHFDHLLPLTASQRQFQMDLLGKGADFIQLNHPARTNCTSREIMEKLSGYRIIELDSGVTTENEYWDTALSAGHYSFALASDDLHHPDRSWLFAVRCSFLNCPSERYEDIKSTLLGGAYYCMRVPDYGEGDWAVKREMNACLPRIEAIGLTGDTLRIALSKPADRIEFTGQGHTTLATESDSPTAEYVIGERDPYVRVTAYFGDGAVIYTNPFARYDASKADSPYVNAPHKVNVLRTAAFNLLLLGILELCVFLCAAMWRRKRSS